MSGSLNGWDHTAVAARYADFDRQHSRYRLANAALARRAAPVSNARVLDLAAGTGGTTAALLPLLGPDARVDCVEPAAAMWAQAQRRLAADPRLRWLPNLAQAGATYDRIVCGAAIWQWPDLQALIGDLASRLAPGGALVFNIPAAYLGQSDTPGGGTDPCLTALMARAVVLRPPTGPAAAAAPLHRPRQISTWLAGAGLHVQRWQHRQRLTQAAWRDWLKIPVLTRGLWPELDADARAALIDAAAAEIDMASWRPERWLGWTAWRPAFACATLAATDLRDADPAHLRAHAQRDGVLLLRQLLPRADLAALGQRVIAAGQASGLLGRSGVWAGPSAAAAHALPCWVALQQQVAMTAEFQALAEHPALATILGRVFGEVPLGHQGSVCRIAPPDRIVPATPAHRDGDYIRNRSGVWTAWVPLTDCSIEQGVLAVAPGSHRDRAATTWAAENMRLGDVLLFSAQTLHRACPNLAPRRARLSVDFRFMPQSGFVQPDRPRAAPGSGDAGRPGLGVDVRAGKVRTHEDRCHRHVGRREAWARPLAHDPHDLLA